MTTRVAMLTAAGSGMGADAARRLATEGYAVAILSSSGKGEALAKEFGGVGVTGSNRSEADLRRLADAAVERWGRIDVLVNSAGHFPPPRSSGPDSRRTRSSLPTSMRRTTYG